MKSHVGANILDEFVKNTLEYQNEANATLKQEMEDGALHRWMAYLLIRNGDQAKYGSLSIGRVSQFSDAEQPVPRVMYDCNRHYEQS